MTQSAEKGGQLGSGENQPIKEGVRITFSNPELLRAFVCDPEMSKRPSTLAERISGIREISLGKFPLDGNHFDSTRVTLIVEPNRDKMGKRPTVIIRADIQLGNFDSNFKKLQQDRLNQRGNTKSSDEDRELTQNEQAVQIPNLEKGDFSMMPWSRNTGRLHRPKFLENFDKEPLVVLQIYDRDIGIGFLSVSLVSNGKYSKEWLNRQYKLQERKADGWEIDEDERDSWQFDGPVGIDVHDAKMFNEAIRFYEKAFSETMRFLYEAEGVPLPDLLYEIDTPLLFENKEKTTFNDIGGQNEAVYYLQQFADLEKRGMGVVGMPGMKRAILLYGPPGNGKSSMAEAFANSLEAPLVRKTTRDLLDVGGNIVKLVESSILEAKALARRTNGKAVLCFEQLEAILGENPIAHDYFLNTMEKLSLDDLQVVLFATSNSKDKLHPGIVSRFAVLPVLPPNERGIREILEIQVKKLAQALRSDVFADVDLDRLAKRMSSIKNLSGRDIFQFLSSSYLLATQGQRTRLNTEAVLAFIPDKSLGFKIS